MKHRQGVSTYLEVFLLIGVATGGTALVMGSTQRLAASGSGPSVVITDAGIRQGSGVAIVRVTITNAGAAAFSSIKLYIGVSAQYCVSVLSLPAKSMVSTTCPTYSGASPVSVAPAVPPGGAVVVAVTFAGGSVFTVGAAYPISVAVPGATASTSAVALPA